MIITELLREQKMSQYRLSKESGVAQSTISELCSGKTSLGKCAAETLYKIAKALGTTVDALLEAELSVKEEGRQRAGFEAYRSNVCHLVKEMGDIDFIIEVLETNEIRRLYERGWYRECFYTLAMVDYLSRLNEIPICENYNDIRQQKLSEPVYFSDVLIQSALTRSDDCKELAKENAIPEFLRFNIVEGEIRNVI